MHSSYFIRRKTGGKFRKSKFPDKKFSSHKSIQKHRGRFIAADHNFKNSSYCIIESGKKVFVFNRLRQTLSKEVSDIASKDHYDHRQKYEGEEGEDGGK